MEELTIGSLLFRSDGKTLTISARDRPDFSFSLERDGVEELIDYVSTLAGTDFNRRHAFRIPIWDSSGLLAVIREGQTETPVTPIDLSLTGMLARLPEESNVEPALEDEVIVTLEFHGVKSMYHAVVKRRTEFTCGLLFPETIVDGELNPPDSLVRVVMELQRQWLAKRSKRPT